MQTGVVIKSTGSWYIVRLEEGMNVECRMKGKFRMQGIKTTNPVAVGDVVDVEVGTEGAVITGIHDRKNYIIRKATNLSKQAHIIAANVDVAMLVVTVNHPVTSTVFIDRFLASAEAYRIPAVLVFNKVDLYDEEEQFMMGALTQVYTEVGYECLHVSAVTGVGLERMKELMRGRVTVFSGLSGVGKSSLVNRVEPGLHLKVEEISDAHDTGRHTTTFAEMFPLREGGYVVDTPGIRAFGLIGMEKGEISHYFPEIFRCSAGCRYNNCTHTHEPGCAVVAAVESGEISESRYFSYTSLLEEGDDKYRKSDY